jgi:hypothetical protein
MNETVSKLRRFPARKYTGKSARSVFFQQLDPDGALL